MIQSNVLEVSLRFDKMLYSNARTVTPSDAHCFKTVVIICPMRQRR